METILQVVPATLAHVLPLLVLATGRKADTCGGLATVQDLCKNAQVFAVKDGGNVVGAYALEVHEFDRGVCLWVQAGAGHLEGIDLTATIHKVIEQQARAIGAKQLGLVTRRPALIKKLQLEGWQIVGTKMIKTLKAGA